MLWDSQAIGVVRRSFLAAKYMTEADRRREAEERLAILEDDWKDLLLCYLRRVYTTEKIYADIQPMVSTEHNVLKRIGRELSTVYQWGAQRTLADASQQKLADGLWEEVQIDETLDLANLYLNVMRDVLLVPTVLDGIMSIDILTPDRVTVTQHPKDPTRIVAFEFWRSANNTPGSYAMEKVRADDKFWTVTRPDGSLVAPPHEHKLGRLPATILHAEKRVDCFWSPSGFSDVVDATYTIGWLMAQLRRTQKWQSELQVTYQGPASNIATGLEVGAHTIWASGDSQNGPGTYGSLDLQADLGQAIGHINATLGWIAGQHGMSADAYSLKVFESGAQLRLARQPLLEQRARQSKLWRRSERDLFRLTAMVAEREHPLYRDLRADTPFSVDFRDEPGLEDPQIQNAVWEKRIQMGLMSQVDALMEIHPDWDRETATKEAQRIVDERAIWVGMVKEMQTAAGSIDSAGATPQENGAKGGRPPGPPPPVQPGQMPTEPAPSPDGGPKY